jgi:hypothetical protein
MFVKRIAVFACLATATACGARTPSSTSASASALAIRDRDVITRAELADPSMGSMNVLEVVRRLRPHFLSDRGVQSHSDATSGRVHASIDNSTVVELEQLRNLLVSHVAEIRFLNAGAAMQRFGGAAREGPVIVVKTM